jgi:DNA-binding PadR family transcriptional regulator
VSPVFGHGSLRLYLLKLLDEAPRHGYDLIRLLEDRFMGTYAPSGGTIYPRLARLETEGLITHSVEDGKKIYRLTERGRAELQARAEELADLEADISRSVHDLADEVREQVRGSLSDVREELKHAARDIRRQQRHENRQRKLGIKDELREAKQELRVARQEREQELKSAGQEVASDRKGERREATSTSSSYGQLERALEEFRQRVRGVAGQRVLTEEELRGCRAALDDAYDRVAAILRQPVT